MLATKFIIALCPATPIYLVKCDVPTNRIFSRHAATVSTETTRVKTEALVFDTFEAAMEICKDITGWGGAQRVEQIAVEVPDTRQTLATEADLCEVRDLCTSEWWDCMDDGSGADWESPRTSATRAEKWIVKALKDRGLKVSTENRATENDHDSPANPLTVYTADHLGNTAQFDFDPMQDGFDITEATCLAEPDHGCAGNCKPLSPKAARALRKWGMEKCQRAWHLNRLRGEGLTVCSIETGIPLRSVDSAINAWQEVWAQNFVPQTCSDCGETNDTVRILDLGDGGHALCSKCNTPDIIPCDGCDSTDAEPCGDPEGFAFCAACRAKDANAPRE